MAAAVWPNKKDRSRKTDPFTRAKAGELDIAMPPPYEMSYATQEAARQQVEALVDRLKPGAFDAGSREVLNNLINAWADLAIAELDAARDERQAVNDVLFGLASEEVARRKPIYDADLARVAQTGLALAVTFEELTGKKADEVVLPRPPRTDPGPMESTLGPIDVSDDETYIDDYEYKRPSDRAELETAPHTTREHR